MDTTTPREGINANGAPAIAHPEPFSKAAEEAVVAAMLATPRKIGEVGATLLTEDHFFLAAPKLLYAHLLEGFYADDPLDPLSVAEARSQALSRVLRVPEESAVQWVLSLAQRGRGDADAPAHALVVKRHAEYRDLLALSRRIQMEVIEERLSPDQIAGLASSESMRIATSAVTQHELEHLGDAGRNFAREMQRRQRLAQMGVMTGARFGIAAIDAYTQGLQPTELLIGGGEPGVGKSAIWWKAAVTFAESQLMRSPDERVGTLILSLEMGQIPSSTRFAQMFSGVDSAPMRTGELSPQQYKKIVDKWREKKDVPLWLNYASGLRLSQLRAVIAEAIRKHNVGLVIVDHFMLLFPDTQMDGNQADNERVIFLKNALAKEFDIAIICIAHTRKAIERADKRPRLADLRGSGAISAFADYVALMYRPWAYATEKDKANGNVDEFGAEMIWAKNRHGKDGTGDFFFDPSRMLVI